jgi:polysaccharide biosynthesis/export protein
MRKRVRSTARSWMFTTCLAVGASSAMWAQQPGPSVPANVEEFSLQRRPMPASAALNQSFTTAAPEDFAKAQLQPGALLSMQIFGVPDMSNVSLRVDDKGDVFVPTLGPVHVAGFTVPQAQDALAAAFVTAQLLVSPVIQLSVVQFAASYVSVLGEVQSPGRFQMIGPRNLAEVLALAGGETLAAGNEIEIQRHDGSESVHVDHVHYTPHDPLENLHNTVIQPGDNVYVRRAGVVYVLGAVNRPGGYVMVNGGLLNVYQALSLAGGTTLDAAKNGMYIVRPHDEIFETIKVPFNKMAKGEQVRLELRQNDVLYIPRSGIRVTLLDGSAIIGAAVNGALYAAR